MDTQFHSKTVRGSLTIIFCIFKQIGHHTSRALKSVILRHDSGDYAINSTLCECITGKQYEDGDSKTHHLDVVQRFFNTGDDEVADAGETTPASRFSR